MAKKGTKKRNIPNAKPAKEFEELQKQLAKQMFSDQFAKFVAANMRYEASIFDDNGNQTKPPTIGGNFTEATFPINIFKSTAMQSILSSMSAKLFGIALSPKMDKDAKVLCAQMLDTVVFASQVIQAGSEIPRVYGHDTSDTIAKAGALLYVYALQYVLYMEEKEGKELFRDVADFVGFEHSDIPEGYLDTLRADMDKYMIKFITDEESRKGLLEQLFIQIQDRIKLMYSNYNKIQSIAPVVETPELQTEQTESKEE